MRPEVLGGLGGFSGAFSLEKIKEMEEPGTAVRNRRMRYKGEAVRWCWTSTTRSGSMRLQCVSMTLPVQAENHCFSSIISHAERTDPEKIASIVKRSCGWMQAVRRGADRRRDGGTSGTDAGG